MVNPTTSPLIFSKLLYNIYLPLPIFLPPTNKNYLVIFLNPSPQKLTFLRSLPYILHCKTQGRRVNTFNSRNRVVYLPLPFAVSRSLTGCGVSHIGKKAAFQSSSLVLRSDIGEVSRSDGGVKFYNQNPIRRLSNPSPQKLPFLRSLPYILHCKTQGRSVESILVQK